MLERPEEFWLVKETKPTTAHLSRSLASTANNFQGTDNLEATEYSHPNRFY